MFEKGIFTTVHPYQIPSSYRQSLGLILVLCINFYFRPLGAVWRFFDPYGPIWDIEPYNSTLFTHFPSPFLHLKKGPLEVASGLLFFCLYQTNKVFYNQGIGTCGHETGGAEHPANLLTNIRT
ncbi:hypothetical protein NPIL_133251 [Nephila pilipes]|uniref:Uncharacterized protein n=1 Tax=Nephila pilipes TaxID=299642 RepID=A0A8X6PK98_NEPPI|nr:hypothetical protein NPIL_133251 [Nephila pilipes]